MTSDRLFPSLSLNENKCRKFIVIFLDFDWLKSCQSLSQQIFVNKFKFLIAKAVRVKTGLIALKLKNIRNPRICSLFQVPEQQLILSSVNHAYFVARYTVFFYGKDYLPI